MYRNKFVLIILLVIVTGVLTLIPKSWIPVEYRKHFLNPKYNDGQCIKSDKHWGVNPKVIVGFKVTKLKHGYLLKDMDRHEHYQFISKIEVETYANVIRCK